jgi:hypothetical protein
MTCQEKGLQTTPEENIGSRERRKSPDGACADGRHWDALGDGRNHQRKAGNDGAVDKNFEMMANTVAYKTSMARELERINLMMPHYSRSHRMKPP